MAFSELPIYIIVDLHENKFKTPPVNIKICVTKRKRRAKARNFFVTKRREKRERV